MEGPGCVAGLHGYTGSRHRPEERVQRLRLSLVPTCRGLTPAPRSESATSPEDPVEPRDGHRMEKRETREQGEP